MLTNCEDELVLNNFLSILAKDIENCPQNLVPMTVEKFIKEPLHKRWVICYN